MRTTIILWPEASLGCPLRSSWGAVVPARFVAGSINDGITTFGANQVEEKRIHECGFLWDQQQLAIFEDFHENTLLAGMRWFMMDFLVAGVMVPCFSHIIGGYRVGDEQGHVTCGFAAESYRRTGTETG